MDRWCGVLKVPLCSDNSTYYRVAASLCLSPTSKTLAVRSVLESHSWIIIFFPIFFSLKHIIYHRFEGCELGLFGSMSPWPGWFSLPDLNSKTKSYSDYSFQVPSANAIFFNGDRVEGTGNSVIERLSDLKTIAGLLVSKFGTSVNAWVIESSVFNGPFAVYKDFIPSVNRWGEPKSYSPLGYPASRSTISLLSNCLKEVLILISCVFCRFDILLMYLTSLAFFLYCCFL